MTFMYTKMEPVSSELSRAQIGVTIAFVLIIIIIFIYSLSAKKNNFECYFPNDANGKCTMAKCSIREYWDYDTQKCMPRNAPDVASLRRWGMSRRTREKSNNKRMWNSKITRQTM